MAVLWISRKRDACATVGNSMANSMVGQPSPVAIMIIPYSFISIYHDIFTARLFLLSARDVGHKVQLLCQPGTVDLLLLALMPLYEFIQ